MYVTIIFIEEYLYEHEETVSVYGSRGIYHGNEF